MENVCWKFSVHPLIIVSRLVQHIFRCWRYIYEIDVVVIMHGISLTQAHTRHFPCLYRWWKKCHTVFFLFLFNIFFWCSQARQYTLIHNTALRNFRPQFFYLPSLREDWALSTLFHLRDLFWIPVILRCNRWVANTNVSLLSTAGTYY